MEAREREQRQSGTPTLRVYNCRSVLGAPARDRHRMRAQRRGSSGSARQRRFVTSFSANVDRVEVADVRVASSEDEHLAVRVVASGVAQREATVRRGRPARSRRRLRQPADEVRKGCARPQREADRLHFGVLTTAYRFADMALRPASPPRRLSGGLGRRRGRIEPLARVKASGHH